MLDVLDQAGETDRPLPSRKRPVEAADHRWSRRRSLAFVIVASSLLWGVILLGIYGLLNLITPR